MYQVITASGEFVESFDNLAEARRFIEGTSHVIKYSQAALALENESRQDVARSMAATHNRSSAVPVYHNHAKHDDVKALADEMRDFYDDWVAHAFGYARSVQGSLYIAPKHRA